MRRTGHTTSATLARYRRNFESAAELGIGNVRPLIGAVPELAQLPPKAVSVATRSEFAGDEQSKYGSEVNDLAEVAEWQTRRIQNPLLARV
jgi:hypothetical protein